MKLIRSTYSSSINKTLSKDDSSHYKLIYHYSTSGGEWKKIYNYNDYISSPSSKKTKYNFLY